LPKSIRAKIKEHGIRNCPIITQPPTGTTSIVAGTSSGIEPIFMPVYERNFNKHKDTHNDMANASSEIIVHPLVEKFIKENRDLSVIEGCHEITPEQHIKMQIICQKHNDQSVSKTINLPANYPESKLGPIISKYLSELKGITIYRDGSKGKSPLVPIPVEKAKQMLSAIKAESSVVECPTGSCPL